MVNRKRVIPESDSDSDANPDDVQSLFFDEEPEEENLPLTQLQSPCARYNPQARLNPSVGSNDEEVPDLGMARSRLQRILGAQRKDLPTQTAKKVLIYGKKRKVIPVKANKVAMSREESWTQMIGDCLAVDRSFFHSAEGRMEDRSVKQRGSVVYNGLKLSINNCADIETVYDIRFRSKVVFSGKKSLGFDGVRCAAGQFMRFTIALGLVDRNDGHKQNVLFRALADCEAVQCFINHFTLTASPYTVSGKCNNLLSIIHVGKIRMGDMDGIQSQLEAVGEYLRSAAAASKRAGRRKSRRQRLIDISTNNHNLLFDADLRKALSIARHKCQDIMNTYRIDEAREKGRFARRLEKCEDLRHKWCLNVLAAVVFSCGGQRPQAIATLQLPTDAEIDRVETTGFGDFFSLRCDSDKTERDANFPLVLFPVSMKPLIEFHRKVMRSYLRDKFNFIDDGVDIRLLLNSKDGTVLESRQITNSIRSFMVYLNKRYEFVTCMTVRASFATSMMHAFRHKRVGKDLSQEKFLDLLANRMNTSAEQLLDAYIHIIRADYEKGVQLAMEHFMIVMGEDEQNEDQCE